MGASRIRYELLVGTHVGTATLATLRIPVRRTAVPRRTLYRLRVPADRDLADTLRRLIDSDVEVVEIRRCAPPPKPARGGTPPPPGTSREDPAPPSSLGDGVVVPHRRATAAGRRGDRPAQARRPSRPAPGETPSAG
ncbi:MULTISPECIES: hypothetical protein [unclassified Blastococcus]